LGFWGLEPRGLKNVRGCTRHSTWILYSI
jgi:hypothetical protein